MLGLGYLELVSRGGGRRSDGKGIPTVYGMPLSTAAPEPGLTAPPEPGLTAAPEPPNLVEKKTFKKTTTKKSSLERARAKQLRRDVEGWVPRECDSVLAIERGYSPEWIADQAERFRDHHRAKGTTFTDIDAAWRNWLRRGFDLDEDPPAVPATRYGVVVDHPQQGGDHPLSDPVR
jgi:hypothetical protein